MITGHRGVIAPLRHPVQRPAHRRPACQTRRTGRRSPGGAGGPLGGRAHRLLTDTGATTPATQAVAMPLPRPRTRDRHPDLSGPVQQRHRPNPHPVGTHHRRPHLPGLRGCRCSHQNRTRSAHHPIRIRTQLPRHHRRSPPLASADSGHQRIPRYRVPLTPGLAGYAPRSGRHGTTPTMRTDRTGPPE